VPPSGGFSRSSILLYHDGTDISIRTAPISPSKGNQRVVLTLLPSSEVLFSQGDRTHVPRWENSRRLHSLHLNLDTGAKHGPPSPSANEHIISPGYKTPNGHLAPARFNLNSKTKSIAAPARYLTQIASPTVPQFRNACPGIPIGMPCFANKTMDNPCLSPPFEPANCACLEVVRRRCP